MGTILQLWPSWPEEGKAPKGSKPLGMTVWVTPSKMQLTTEVLSKVGGNTELAIEGGDDTYQLWVGYSISSRPVALNRLCLYRLQVATTLKTLHLDLVEAVHGVECFKCLLISPHYLYCNFLSVLFFYYFLLSFYSFFLASIPSFLPPFLSFKSFTWKLCDTMRELLGTWVI